MKKIILLILVLLNIILSTGCETNDNFQMSSVNSLADQDIKETITVTYAKTDNVQIKAAKNTFPKDTELNISLLSVGQTYELAVESLSKIAERFVIYDINAKKDNIPIQPNGNVSAEFNIPQDFDINMTDVIFISDQGEIEYIQSKINEDSRTITATLSHFSTYAVVDINSIKAKLENYILNTHKPGSGGGDCLKFVKMLCMDIFKHSVYWKSDMELRTTDDNGITCFVQVGNTLSVQKNNLSESSLKELFLKAHAGDIVQMDYTTYKPKKKKDGSYTYNSQHTMMIYAVSEKGVWLYHRGSSGHYFGRNDKNGDPPQPLWGTNKNLDCSPVTWKDLKDILKSDDDGISIFRSVKALCNNGHKYSKATCTQPKTCGRCGQTSGNSLGHNFSNATCTKGASCSRCSATTNALGHNYSNATCIKSATCTRCKKTTGSPLGHDFSNVTCTKGGSCNRCSAMQKALGHNYVNGICSRCSATNSVTSTSVPKVFYGTFIARTTSSNQTLNNDDLSQFVITFKSNSDSFGSWGTMTYTGYEIAENHYNKYYKNEYANFQTFLKNTPDKILHNGKYYVANTGDGDTITNLKKQTYSITFYCDLLSENKIEMKYSKKNNIVDLTVVSNDKRINGLVFTNSGISNS